MVKKSLKKMDEKLEALSKEIGKVGPATRGSVVLIGTKTKQYYLSVKVKGKTRIIFLGKKRVGKAREYLKNYTRILEIIEKMTYIVINRLREAEPD
jgi:hypothetical protein